MRQSLQMVRGDTFSFDLELSDVNVDDITSIYFTVKSRLADEVPVFEKNLSNGITYIDNNTFRVRVEPDDTIELEPGIYVYDIEVSVGKDVYTVLRGTMLIVSDVSTKWR